MQVIKKKIFLRTGDWQSEVARQYIWWQDGCSGKLAKAQREGYTGEDKCIRGSGEREIEAGAGPVGQGAEQFRTVSGSSLSLGTLCLGKHIRCRNPHISLLPISRKHKDA